MEIKQLELFDSQELIKPANKRDIKLEAQDDYLEFLKKFERKKTTDDCYTPNEVYQAVVDFVKSIYPLDGKQIVRLFFPGGDYENYEYPRNGIVIDNPPFSIISKIVRFYAHNGIPFFLFAPALTLTSKAASKTLNLTYVVCGVNITYDNGAKVPTSFITNITPELKFWVCPQLRQAIEKSQSEAKESKTLSKVVYPDNLIIAPKLHSLALRGIELKILEKSCRSLDGRRLQCESMSPCSEYRTFGTPYLLSSKAAAEKAAAEKAAAEKAAAEKAAAEKAAAEKAGKIVIKLTQNELDIISELDRQDGD